MGIREGWLNDPERLRPSGLPSMQGFRLYEDYAYDETEAYALRTNEG